MADTCRCHLPFDPPAPPAVPKIAVSAQKRQDLVGFGAEPPIMTANGQPATFWWPRRDPEPGPAVQAVASYGDDPGFLRRVRVPGGWHTEGSGANHPDCTPTAPWPEVGRCWAAVDHPVVDVTHDRRC